MTALALALAALAAQPLPPATGAPVARPDASETYEVRGEPGVDRTIFHPDGTYVDYFQGRRSGGGRFAERPDGQLCFTPDTGGEAACWVMEGAPDADGWATSVRQSDGLRIQVRPARD